jgi:hypothetical protein
LLGKADWQDGQRFMAVNPRGGQPTKYTRG